MFKLLKWLIIAVVLLIILIAVGISWSIDSLIRHVVETQATASLNLPTTLGSANLSILGGSLGLNDLNIASPQGFAAPQMFSLGSAGVSVSYGNLRGNPVKIDTITLDKPKLVIEQSGGKFNIQAVMGQQSKAPPADSNGGQTLKLIVGTLTVSNADVVIRPGAPIPGVPTEIPITIPSITMQNIGNADGANNGVAIKDLLVQVMQAIESKAGESDKLPPEVKALLSGNLGNIGADVKQKMGRELNALKGNGSDSMKGALNGLLGGDKKGN
jgi:uncharacterized protein involved in outer membrane biogenesis